jgi:DNA polymerase IV
MSSEEILPGFCRDCLADASASQRCAHCGSPRLLRHREVDELCIAHIDCDAFYATIEKRDNPVLKDRPVLIGGGKRGVVATACYIARIHGVHSAMPMFKALKACPEAVVIAPDIKKYSDVGREVRQMMLNLTPYVEPISIDEAFLDLHGTQRLHKHSPARTLAQLATRIEKEIGITVSIGLSYNKFLAKIASDMDKPLGFSIIGRQEAQAFLKRQNVSIIWGVGAAMQRKLKSRGISTIADLLACDQASLIKHYGVMGERLYNLARAQDNRQIKPSTVTKSVSAETTFSADIKEKAELERILWRLCEKVSARAKAKGIAGRCATLKLKTSDFKSRTRSRTLDQPTQLADRLFEAAKALLEPEADGTAFRLIGIGFSQLENNAQADQASLFDQDLNKRADVEHAMDTIREKFGTASIEKGIGFKPGG